MEQSLETSQDQTNFAAVQKNLQLRAQLKSGANWFYWIAGLSLLNSLIFLFGGNINFVVGLGITQLVDGIMYYLGLDLGLENPMILRYIGLGFDFLVAGLFAVCGFFAHKKNRWLFVLGIMLYILDALLLLWIGDIMSMLFHGLALFGLIKGFRVIKQINELEMAMPADQVERVDQMTIQQPAPTYAQREDTEESRKKFKSYIIIVIVATVGILGPFLIMLLLYRLNIL